MDTKNMKNKQNDPTPQPPNPSPASPYLNFLFCLLFLSLFFPIFSFLSCSFCLSLFLYLFSMFLPSLLLSGKRSTCKRVKASDSHKSASLKFECFIRLLARAIMTVTRPAIDEEVLSCRNDRTELHAIVWQFVRCASSCASDNDARRFTEREASLEIKLAFFRCCCCCSAFFVIQRMCKIKKRERG